MQTRVALVTGGTGAIGRVICQQLVDAGFRVAANCYPGDAEAAAAWVDEEARDRCRTIHLEPFRRSRL